MLPAESASQNGVSAVALGPRSLQKGNLQDGGCQISCLQLKSGRQSSFQTPGGYSAIKRKHRILRKGKNRNDRCSKVN